MYSRVSERAFDALLTKFFETLDEKAASTGCRGSMIEGYKTGYLLSFFSMELAALDEEAQFRMYHVISDRIIRLRKDIRAKDLELTAREVMIA
jgi:hypothetical protein